MARTHFQNFTRDDGLPVTVEYQVESEGEPDFDHPGHICDGGGSEPVMAIVGAWPNDDAYEHLADRHYRRLLRRGLWNGLCRRVLEARMTWAQFRRSRLSPAEVDRMEAWLAEHWEPPDDSDYYEDFREA
jgi:hypothetical protein